MKVLLIGGTGLISTGIIKHLLARDAEVWMLNRAKRENTLPEQVRALVGDRHKPGVIEDAAKGHFDAVIDMCCFDPETCTTTLAAFAGKTKHFIFCSTVCTYGVKVPGGVLIDETFRQEPISGYGRNKVACEKLVFEAGGSFGTDGGVTVIRPSHTYGPGSSMIDQLEPDGTTWDRVEKGLPVVVADSGMGLWVSTHRDDCGQLFALATLSTKAFGQAYNATRDEHLTWADYYRHVGAALGREPKLVTLPAESIWKRDEKRFGLLKEITAYHGAYSSAKARQYFPEWKCGIDLTRGSAETFRDIRRRHAWKSSQGDEMYEELVKRAEG